MSRKLQSLVVVVCAVSLVAGLVAYYGRSSLAKSAAIEWRIANAIDEFQDEAMPIAVTKISQGGKAIRFDEPFGMSAEALANASVGIRNVSDKEIKDLSLVLALIDPQTNKMKAMSSSVKFNVKIPANGQASGVIDSKVVGELKRLSVRSKIPLTQLRINIDWVEFADSTRWMYGMTLLSDPERPGNWYVKGAHDLYRSELLKKERQGGNAVYSKAGTQFDCYYLAYTQNIPCDPIETCGYNVQQQNFSSFQNGPKLNFDFVYTECAPGCTAYPMRVVGSCPN